MTFHFHNFVRVSAAFTAPPARLTINVRGGSMGYRQGKQLERLALGFTTITQRCTVCDRRRTVTKTGDLTTIE